MKYQRLFQEPSYLGLWSGQTDTSLSAKAIGFRGIKLQTKNIPPKAMRYLKLLDIYFFRQHKLFVRRSMEKYIRCDENHAINLHDRIVIFRLYSFVYYQLRAPEYYASAVPCRGIVYVIFIFMMSYKNIAGVCLLYIPYSEDCK